MTRTLKVDLFTDIVCPWCLIGAIRLDKAIEKLPADIAVDVENHPFYLDPQTPPEGYVVADMLREKYGREPEQIWARAEAAARESGIGLELAKQPRSVPTAAAHTLVRAARVKGTQHALANAITWAYFMEHQPLDDAGTLAGIATRHGFAREEALQVMTDANELGTTADMALAAARQGITGVPFFVFNQRYALSGCQPQQVFDNVLVQVLEASAAPAAD